MKIWLKILITALIAGAMLGFTLFCFYFFDMQDVPAHEEPSLRDMLEACRAIPYGVMFFSIMVVAEIAWYSDSIFKKKK